MAKASKGDDIKVIKGRVLFDADEELGDVEASEEDQAALIKTVKTLWDRYLHMDLEGFGALLAKDVTRMSQRTRELQSGSAEVLAGMPKEWESFERPDNLIAEEMTLRSMEITVDDEEEASAATVVYWVEIEAGARWHYDDQGVVLQAFEKHKGAWKLVHQIDVWSTDYDLDEEEPGAEPTFLFDYVYPVKDLARAVDFYTPLLGKPDAVIGSRAYFGLRGPRFILDSSDLAGHAVVRDQLPNGYAAIYVSDLDAERKRLIDKGVTFLAGTDRKNLAQAGDEMALLRDASGNVVALVQRDFGSATGASEVRGLDGDGPYLAAARALAQAWIGLDAATLARYHGDDGSWIDDTRTSTRGLEYGKDALKKAFKEAYWPRYDRSDKGICARLEASSVSVRKVGEQTLVSYVRQLTGTGPHPFRERAFVTHVFDDKNTIAYSFTVSASRSEGLAVELDYTGHPVADLKKAEHFYTETMALGSPYVDEEWRGWWSNNTVYGAYTADPARDGIPQKDHTNGYVSFWVRSAEEAHAYLKAHGSSFPVIPAINTKAGIDKNPGYTQAVGTDSEGNVVIFSEYSGKKK
jgi:catechol 2,3-dioxygenase-like lactoylglutathione lyase family enzyme/ketosteroid isomerase-like protein